MSWGMADLLIPYRRQAFHPTSNVADTFGSLLPTFGALKHKRNPMALHLICKDGQLASSPLI